ncbi:MAG: response regulator, partial [Nitrospinae bacterium]|nr:response regulator [Nitrospinota bacterium]
ALGLHMPGTDGLEVIRRLAARKSLPPAIIVTGHRNVEVAVEAMKLGAVEYIVKDTDGRYLELLPAVIERALRLHWLAAEKKWMEAQLRTLNEAFLDLTPDFHSNIQRLVEACGEILGADDALYGRLVDGRVYSVDGWQTFGDYNPAEARPGHICYDVVKRGGKDGIVIISNLQATPYARTDPNVAANEFKTYVGQAVSCFSYLLGALVVAYQDEVALAEGDIEMIGILATAIGIEEERMLAEVALLSPDAALQRSADAPPPQEPTSS